jgi:thiol:disulfide interchange protein
MRKIIISIIALCFITGAIAQETEQSRQQREKARYEQVVSAKIAFFTTSLGLTPQEAEAFWPIYNNYWKERESLHKRIQNSLVVMNKFLNDEKKSDNDIKKFLEIYISHIASDGLIQKKYQEEFLKVLTVRQVARLYTAEEEFRIKMIHQLRGGNR